MSVTNWVFYHRQGEPGLPGDPGDPGDLGLKVNTNIHTLQGLPFNINTGVWNLNYKLLFEENVTIVFDLIKWRAVKMNEFLLRCVKMWHLFLSTGRRRDGGTSRRSRRSGWDCKETQRSLTHVRVNNNKKQHITTSSVCLLKSHMINGNTSPSLHHWSLHTASLSLCTWIIPAGVKGL